MKLVTNIREVWFEVRRGLEIVLRHSAEDWIPEDVWSALTGGKAHLFMSDDGSFVVVTYGDTNMHVWCAYGNLDAHEPEVCELARLAGKKKLTFASPRKGWERRLKNRGWKPVQVFFEKDLL